MTRISHPLIACLALLVAGCASLHQPERQSRVPSPPAAAPVESVVPLFRDATGACGLPEIGARFVYWLDFDNDLRPDLLVDGARLFRNSGPQGCTFAEVTDAVGLSNAPAGAVACFDFDNDGWTDIVTTHGALWRNESGARFVNVAEAVEFRPHPKAGAIGCGDVNGDGWADVYVAMREDWNKGNPSYYPHQLWLNHEGQRFTEIGKRAGIDKKMYGRGVLFSDVDGDGRQDIFVACYRLQPNLLWMNRGNCRFRDAAGELGVAGRRKPDQYLDPVRLRRYGPHWGHTIGACWWDFDNDGRQDLFTANLVHKYVGPSNRRSMAYDVRGYVCDDSAIYRRDGAKFTDWRAKLGVPLMPMGGPSLFQGDELWAGCTPGDANNDGWMDVFVPQVYNLRYAKARLFLNAAGARLTDRAAEAGIHRLDTYAGAWADIDLDGRLDLATAGRPGKDKPVRLCLYRNQGAPDRPPNRWIKVRLVQRAQADGLLGSAVTVEYGGLRLYQEFAAGSSSYGQSNDPTLHFGLGAEIHKARIAVRWPDGVVTQTDADPNRLLKIVRPPPAPSPPSG